MSVKEIKKIKVISWANILAVIYLYFLIKSLFRRDILITSWWEWGSNFVYALFFAFLIALFAAFLGWIWGLLCGFFYNFFAVRLGGIKLECEETGNKNKLFNF